MRRRRGVYERLDYPAVIHGRSYRNVYYAEQHSLVKQGDRVYAGQPVMIAGLDELGFAKDTGDWLSNPRPKGPLIPGPNGTTQPTREGRDFYDFLYWIQSYLKAH